MVGWIKKKLMSIMMDKKIDEKIWMVGWIKKDEKKMDGWMDGFKKYEKNMDGWMDKKIIDGWWMDRKKEKIDGWLDGWIEKNI